MGSKPPLSRLFYGGSTLSRAWPRSEPQVAASTTSAASRRLHSQSFIPSRMLASSRHVSHRIQIAFGLTVAESCRRQVTVTVESRLTPAASRFCHR